MDLSRLLSPTAIALVGASSNPKSVGGQPLRYMREFGYAGKLFPVNPNRKEVQGLACYKSLHAVHEACDVAVITVPAAHVAAAVRDCAAVGIPYAIVLSAGFQDAGAAGSQVQKDLEFAIAESGVRVVGPNSSGVVNLHGVPTALKVARCQTRRCAQELWRSFLKAAGLGSACLLISRPAA